MSRAKSARLVGYLVCATPIVHVSAPGVQRVPSGDFLGPPAASSASSRESNAIVSDAAANCRGGGH